MKKIFLSTLFTVVILSSFSSVALASTTSSGSGIVPYNHGVEY